jgi:hypothetical protein
MPISVTEVGGSGPSVEEGQYDLSLESVEQVAPKEGTDYSAQILLQWRVEGKENPGRLAVPLPRLRQRQMGHA